MPRSAPPSARQLRLRALLADAATPDAVHALVAQFGHTGASWRTIARHARVLDPAVVAAGLARPDDGPAVAAGCLANPALDAAGRDAVHVHVAEHLGDTRWWGLLLDEAHAGRLTTESPALPGLLAAARARDARGHPALGVAEALTTLRHLPGLASVVRRECWHYCHVHGFGYLTGSFYGPLPAEDVPALVQALATHDPVAAADAHLVEMLPPEGLARLAPADLLPLARSSHLAARLAVHRLLARCPHLGTVPVAGATAPTAADPPA